MIVYLKPRAPFANNAPRSDTLFGAIAWAVRVLYGNDRLERLLAGFDAAVSKQSPAPFVISSLFPFFEDAGGKLLFLPRPLRSSEFDLTPRDLAEYQTVKKLKRAGLISLSLFDAIANGRLNERDLLDEALKGENGDYRLSAGAAALMTRDEYERVRVLPSLFATAEIGRNSLNRLTGSTSGDGGHLFYQPVTSSRAWEKGGAESGFYCAIRLGGEQSDETEATIKAAFRFLGDKGLGGDSSIGRGHCEVEFDGAKDISGPAGGPHLFTISLLHPSEADRAHFTRCQSDIYAKLERRKGFIESGYVSGVQRVWKPTLIMLAEGATFPRDGDRPIYGALYEDKNPREGLDFRPRINGLAYTVPIGSGQEEQTS